MTSQLNPAQIADDVLINAPEVTAAAVAPVAIKPMAEPVPAQPVLYDDTTSQRHGRVAARSINMSLKTATGEGLDNDTSDTLGDILSEVFGLASRHLNRMVYIAILGVCVVPMIAVVAMKILKTNGEGTE